MVMPSPGICSQCGKPAMLSDDRNQPCMECQTRIGCSDTIWNQSNKSVTRKLTDKQLDDLMEFLEAARAAKEQLDRRKEKICPGCNRPYRAPAGHSECTHGNALPQRMAYEIATALDGSYGFKFSGLDPVFQDEILEKIENVIREELTT